MASSTFRVEPLSVGARIRDLPADAESDPDTRRALYQTWLEFGFLLFEDIETEERQIALSKCFGELELHSMVEMHHPNYPYLIELGGPRRIGGAFVFDERDIRVGPIAWHRDTAYTPYICKGGMLRMIAVPEHAGETMLCDTAKGWDDLPQRLKQKLEGLEYKATVRPSVLDMQGRPGAFWKTVRCARNDEYPDSEGALEKLQASGIATRYPSVVHPAVMKHPESGRKCIMLSLGNFDAFLGLSEAESEALLREVADHMLQPKYVYAHKWKVNEAILWDNRRMMHAGKGNDPREPRHALRSTLAEPLHTGRFYEPSQREPAPVNE